MHTERTLKWPENPQPMSPVAGAPRLDLKEWKAQHLARTPASATAVLTPAEGGLLATVSAADKTLAQLLIPPGSLDEFVHAFLGSTRGTDENRRTIERAAQWLDRQGAGKPSADGSGLITVNGVQPRTEAPPDPPK